MNRLCAAVLLFAVLFCLPRSAGAGEPLAAVSESELARIVHEGDGRPLVLVYWASWCVPCRHFREKLEKIRAGYPESELRMLAVSLDRDPGPAMAYLARSPLPYPARIGDAELIKARSGMPVPMTILYRWAQQMGYDVSGRADLSAFPDNASVAAYATEPMTWAIAEGIISGTTEGLLNPAGTATRAQFAVILYRFFENVM